MSDWIPQPKQSIALEQTAFEILMGGGRGSGKTEAGIAFPLYNIQYPEYRALVLRKNSDDLKDWIDRAEVFYARCGARRVGNPANFIFPSGAIIRTGHLKDENAYRKYQGHEYHNILIEEIQHIASVLSYLMVVGSCRSSSPRIKAQVFGTANPDGPGQPWIKERWNIPDEPYEPITTIDEISKRRRIFIPANIDDNPALIKSDPEYVKYLESLPDGLREKWRSGSWADFDIKGAVYINEIRQLIKEKRHRFIPHEPLLPVHTVWDLGQSTGNAMSIGLYQALSTELRLIGHYSNESFGFPHYFAYLQDIQRERGYVYGKHFAPFDINVKELSTGKTRYQIAKDAGWNFEVVPQLSKEDGIMQVRLLFPKLWVNNIHGGKEALHAWRNYHYEFDDKRMAYSREPVHDWSSNCSDMLRYTAISYPKMLAQNKKTYNQSTYRSRSPYEGGGRSTEDFT